MPEQDELPARFTTVASTPSADNQNSFIASDRGLLLQDAQLLEKLARLNRERTPERVVYANGCGAHGTLRVTADLSDLTCASVLKLGSETKVIARFSNVAGELGAADHERDARGFALKFYTDEGNWDLVGGNTPVFFIRDPAKFPDLVHTQKRHPRTNLRSNTAMWDFWSQSPESLHQVTMLFSDRGLPLSPMHMNGYGCHTYSLWNQQRRRVWVKFHFKTLQGHRHVTNEQAEEIVGRTRDGFKERLWSAIEAGDFPRWTMQVQIMTQAKAEACRFNPFDVTKVWPHADCPPIDIGTLELNRNADDHFSEIEQLAFSPSNIVPGIGHSPDRILISRILAYPDAQRYRLGNHYAALPVNRERCPASHSASDGTLRFFEDVSTTEAQYEPYSFERTSQSREYDRLPTQPSDPIHRSDHRDGNSDFWQPRNLFMQFDCGQKARLFDNIATSLKDVPEAIASKQIDLFEQVHPQYGAGVCAALGDLDPQF